MEFSSAFFPRNYPLYSPTYPLDNFWSGVTADLESPPGKSASGYGPPSQIWTHQTFLSASFVSYLATNSTYKLLSMFFLITTQHSSVKIKINSYFAPIVPHLLWRVVQYTQELNANKLLHSNYWNCCDKFLLLLMRINIDTKRHIHSRDYCVQSKKLLT